MAQRIPLPSLRYQLAATLLLAGCDGSLWQTTWSDGSPRAPVAVVLAPPSTKVKPLQTRVSSSVLRVRALPDTDSAIVGRIAAGAPFHIFEMGETTSACPEIGWARVAQGAWSCLDPTEETQAAAVRLPVLLAFDPPRPDESAEYFKTGTWPRDDDGEPPLLPFVYGKRWLRWAGPEYESMEALQADDPLRELGGLRKYAFTGKVETDHGTVLTRDDGHVVPLDGVYVYPTTRFEGVDLAIDSPPDGGVPAWSVATRGVDVLAFPTEDAEVSWQAPFHRRLWAYPHEPDAPQGWIRVSDASDEHAGGWVRTGHSIRVWRHAPPPEVALDTVWLDVDLNEQMLAIRRGDLALYITLVSTGGRGDETPTGLYRIYDKAAWWDMASLPTSTQPYHLESVPWVMHFWPRYALHTAFWHNRFGHVMSHGCVNLAPRDAKVIFDSIHPIIPEGWWVVNQTLEDPGTFLRVREGDEPVVDKRRGF